MTAEPEALAAIARRRRPDARVSLTDRPFDGRGHPPIAFETHLGLVPEDEFVAMLDSSGRAARIRRVPGGCAARGSGRDSAGFSRPADMIRAQPDRAWRTAVEVSERAEALVSRKDRFAAGDLLRMLQAVGELEPR